LGDEGSLEARLRRRAQSDAGTFRPLVASGLALCARCGLSIAPGAAWDLGHTEDRSVYSGPEHRKCNQLAGARKGAAVSHAQLSATRRWSQNWNAPDPPPPDVIVLSER
jgi:hypothetical protein